MQSFLLNYETIVRALVWGIRMQPHPRCLHAADELIGTLREQQALLLRLKEMRRLGQHDGAGQLARHLELLDQSDDWAMR